MTLWVTGADGFSGRHLLDFLSAQPDRPRLVGIGRHSGAGLACDEYCRLDLTDTEALAELARRQAVTGVIHAAGTLPPGDAGHLFIAHAQTTASLITALQQAGRRGTRVLCVGSAAEYLPPFGGPVTESHPTGGLSPYGQSKSAQTALALHSGARAGLEVVVVRPFNLVGPGMSARLVLGWLAAQYADPAVKEVAVGNLQSRRDFIDVRDAAAGYWQIFRRGLPGTVYNLGRGESVSIEDLCHMLSDCSGRRLPLRVAAERVRAQDPAEVVADVSRLRELMEWSPAISVRESIEDML